MYGMQYNENPQLIDSSTGMYLYNTLKQCHANRVQTYSWFLNVAVVCIFIGLGGFILYLCFQRKLTPDQQKEKLIAEQKYILEKIKTLKEVKQNYYEEGTMTHLPFPESSIPPI